MQLRIDTIQKKIAVREQFIEFVHWSESAHMLFVSKRTHFTGGGAPPTSGGGAPPASLPRGTSPEGSPCGSSFIILRIIARILNCLAWHCQVCRIWLRAHIPQHVSWLGVLAKRTQSGFEHAERQMWELRFLLAMAILRYKYGARGCLQDIKS